MLYFRIYVVCINESCLGETGQLHVGPDGDRSGQIDLAH